MSSKLWSLEALAQSPVAAMAASCVRNLRGSDRLFAAEIQNTHAYPTSNVQPKPEVGT